MLDDLTYDEPTTDETEAEPKPEPRFVFDCYATSGDKFVESRTRVIAPSHAAAIEIVKEAANG